MKKTYIKIIIQELKQSLGRFMAILGIVALGVGFLSGLLVTTPDMHLSVDEYYDKNNMSDVFIKATMGLTEKDFKEISSLEEIDKIMPAYVVDTLMETSNSEILATRVYGMPIYSGKEDDAYINHLELLKGRMPQNDNECVVERKGSALKDIPLNSKLVISDQNEDFDKIDDIYKVKEYTVVGIVSNSFYFSYETEITNIGNGKIGAIIYVDKSSYALDVYTDFYLTATGAMEMDTFSKEYETMTDEIIEKLENISKERSKIRYKEVMIEANDKLDEGKEKYEDAKITAETELADAKKKIDDGKIKLKKAEKDIRDGEKELADGRLTLARETKDAQFKIQDAKLELEDALLEIRDGEQELKDAWIELVDGQKEYQDGYIEYLDAEKELEAGQVEFNDGEKKYLDGIKEIDKAKKDIKKGESELSSASGQLSDARAQYNAGVRELAGQKSKFDQGVGQYAGALGFGSVDELFNTIENDSSGSTGAALETVVSGSVTQVEGGISEAKAGIAQLEAGIAQEEAKLEAATEEEIPVIQGTIVYLQGELSSTQATLGELQATLAAMPKSSDVLKNGWKAIKGGESELDSAREQIADGERQYEDGVDELRDGKKELAKAEQELKDAKVELEENRVKLSDGWKELEEAKTELEDAKIKLEDGYKEYDNGKTELEDGKTEYNDGVKELSEAEQTLKYEIRKANKELEEGEAELADGQIEYNDGIKEISEGEAEYLKGEAEAEEKLSEAAEEIKDAEKKIADIETPKWYVLGRNSNMSYVSFLMNAEKAAAISKVFPVFFYLVAALVTLTTMTRMVEEQRSQIGTLKALGYTRRVIISKYLIYCGLASALGSVVGLIVGFKLIPYVIWNAYGVMYHLPSFITDINPKIALISAGLAILSTMGATVYAVSHALKEKPSTLMLPKAPKAGKRIMLERVNFIWSRMSFNHKATARNLFRYKKHFFMTVIGISGCTALLVAGFGLRDSIGDVANTQFLEIFKYDILVEMDEDKESDIVLQDVVVDKNYVEDSIEVFTEKAQAKFGDETMDISISIPENSQSLENFIDLRDRKTGKGIDFKIESVVITEKAAENLRLNIGDSLTLENEDKEQAEFIITNITENYLGNYVYMNKDMYTEVFNRTIKNNSILLKSAVSDENKKDELISKLLISEKVLNAGFITDTKKTFDNLLTSINYIVLVIILASGLLAFIVLYNLTNININERKKELATLKVLGFYNEEVSAYIFRETFILSLIGMGVGLLLGIVLHKFIIVVIEDPEFMFGRTISWLSFGLSAAVTMLFSLIVNLFMLKKLKNIKMVDSMKAID